MNYLVYLPEPMKLYYSKKVYSPQYSSIDTIIVASRLVKDGKKPYTTVLDVGCGSGIIGLGVKKLNPLSQVTLCDIDPEAVRVTKLNAKRLGLDVTCYQADMIPVGYWDIICANMPTYSEEDMKQELHGPEVAYFAGEPLSFYEKLFEQAEGRCKALVCECQEKYQKEFLALAKKRGWELALLTDMAFAFFPASLPAARPSKESRQSS